METLNEFKRQKLSVKVDNIFDEANESKKLELLSKISLLDCITEEFFNKCHDSEGRFCPGSGGISGHADTAKPSSPTRSWIDHPGKQQMVIIYHEATRAGPHIDVHIGHLSLIYRVKPELQSKLSFRNGLLTASSKSAIIDHIKSEVSNRSRVPQNLDHSLKEARQEWVGGSPGDKSYGAGKSRQIVDESTINVYKASKSGPIEFYAPHLNPDKGMYIHKLYPGDAKRAPILIWGNRASHPPKFEDRLHLKSIPPEDVHKLQGMHITAKYDGASAYVSITPKGTSIWSPRISKKTGEQLEYTPKLGSIATITSPESITALGELLFKKDGKYLSASETGGLLNAHHLLPDDVHPEIRLYRIDRVGRKSTIHLPFEENRALQTSTSKLNSKYLKVVELTTPEESKVKHPEGVVAVPKGKSVNEGYKLKWRDDPHDWEITKVDFKVGPKGSPAGVVHLKSLSSGKTFKLGPGQMGNHTLVKHMMQHPDDYVGTVVKVHSHHGHEGRSAKVISFHLDKGVAPPKIS